MNPNPWFSFTSTYCGPLTPEQEERKRYYEASAVILAKIYGPECPRCHGTGRAA